MGPGARSSAPPYDAVMADRDSAFLWETEAIRASPRQADPGDGWLTLREASEKTGIPIATLRKWARRDTVPSYLEDTPLGQLRMVSREGVRRRAAELGRSIKEISPPPPPPREKPPTPQPVTSVARHLPDQAEPPPPGTMLVPIDAWDKMLMQLGNLHQAGQELATARERAARAETEVRFLKERLAELRTPEEAPTPQPEAAMPDVSRAEAENEEEAKAEQLVVTSKESDEARGSLDLPSYSLAVLRHLYGTWRNRPRR
jgi:DNA-binding transcriptional MerR regulator